MDENGAPVAYAALCDGRVDAVVLFSSGPDPTDTTDLASLTSTRPVSTAAAVPLASPPDLRPGRVRGLQWDPEQGVHRLAVRDAAFFEAHACDADR